MDVISPTHKVIWTIGHSTRSQEDFISCLKSFEIGVLVDVRRYPGSRKYPQFNPSALESYLPQAGIRYIQQPDLGGRRKPRPDSRNTQWRNESFRGYADYAETGEFSHALANLAATALKYRTAYMCSEAVWWRCHRAIISDYLKAGGWTVMHIMKENSAGEHPFTSAFLTRQDHSSGDS